MDIEEIVFRRYKGFGNVMYGTRKEAEDSFNFAKVAGIVPPLDTWEHGYSRSEVVQIILDNKDRLLKILQEVK